jgi:hypothetical protein
MELETKYQWNVVSPTLVFNKYGTFSKYGKAFLFSGSYLTPRWVKYWHDEYLVDTDPNRLMKVVEEKISHYRRNHCLFGICISFVVFLLSTSFAAAAVYVFSKLIQGM